MAVVGTLNIVLFTDRRDGCIKSPSVLLVLLVTGHFSVKIDFTQFRKYRSLCNRQVKHIGAEHLLFFRKGMSFSLQRREK